MKDTGIVRKIDDLGRIVIPMELRKIFGLNVGEPLEIYTDNGDIILHKAERKGTSEAFDDGYLKGFDAGFKAAMEEKERKHEEML